MYGEEVSGYNNIFDNNVTCLWRDGYGEGTFGKTTGVLANGVEDRVVISWEPVKSGWV